MAIVLAFFVKKHSVETEAQEDEMTTPINTAIAQKTSSDYERKSISSTPGLHPLTAPTLFEPLPESDGLNELLQRHIAVEYRAPRDLTGAYHGAKIGDLIIKRGWRSVARWSKDRIVECDPSDSEKLLKLWHLRLLSLCKLRLFNHVAREATRLVTSSEKTDLRNETWPFELEVLLARVPAMTGDIYETIDRLYVLLRLCKREGQIVKADSITLILVRYFYDLQDSTTAIRLMTSFAQSHSTQPEVWLALSKLHLACGDITKGHAAIEKANEVMGSTSPAEDNPILGTAFAMLYLASGQWDMAQEIFEQQKQNLSSSAKDQIVCINNTSVTCLYQGQLAKGIDGLEGLLTSFPEEVSPAEPVLFNLATLYELQSEASGEKKVRLLDAVSKKAGDGFAAGCLKMPM